jgi:hypothetical protein
MTDFIYTLICLFVLTTLLVINLPYITTFVQSIGEWKNWSSASVKRFIEEKGLKRGAVEDGDSTDAVEEGIELRERDLGPDRLPGGEV